MSPLGWARPEGLGSFRMARLRWGDFECVLGEPSNVMWKSVSFRDGTSRVRRREVSCFKFRERLSSSPHCGYRERRSASRIERAAFHRLDLVVFPRKQHKVMMSSFFRVAAFGAAWVVALACLGARRALEEDSSSELASLLRGGGAQQLDVVGVSLDRLADCLFALSGAVRFSSAVLRHDSRRAPPSFPQRAAASGEDPTVVSAEDGTFAPLCPVSSSEDVRLLVLGLLVSLLPALVVVSAVYLIALVRRLRADYIRIKYPPPYYDVLASEIATEVRPRGDVLNHVLLLLLGRDVLGFDSVLYNKLLKKANVPFAEWDVPFDQLPSKRRKTPEAFVRAYCDTFGMAFYDEKRPAEWPWAKLPAEYLTMNDWFMRGYRAELAVERVVARNLREAADSESRRRRQLRGSCEAGQFIVAPGTAVVSFFRSWTAMPRAFKNDAWRDVGEIGIGEKFLAALFDEQREQREEGGWSF